MIDIDQKIENWKNKLLDLGKRNRLLNYRDTKRSNLRINQPDFISLWNSFVINEKPLVFPYIEDQPIVQGERLSSDDSANEEGIDDESGIVTNQSPKERQKTLRSIRDKARTAFEEQGVNVLYLAFGFLKWFEAAHSTQEIYSPIILVPVTITWESITSPFVLNLFEDDIVVNPTLTYKLENDFGIKLPEFDEDDIEAYFIEIEKIVANNNWSIQRDTGLSLFSFLKINMYRDLDSHRDKIKENPIIRALTGDASGIDGDAIAQINNYDHDAKTLPTDIFQVVDADASQQDAILCAKRGISFVLQGPPGTGKSQTITNIIAERLAEGKKVLFVSEKMAALEVVHRRLTNAGLSDFCLTLHSHKANKKEILAQLRTALDLSRVKIELNDEAFQQLNQLKSDRDALNAYTEAVYTKIAPLNKSIYDVNGLIASLQNYDEVIFDIDDVENTSMQRLNEYISLLNKLADIIGKMTGDYKDNPWHGASVDYVSHELRHDLNAKLKILIAQTAKMSSLFDEASAQLSLDLPSSYVDMSNAIAILDVAAVSPIVPVSWIVDSDIESLYQEIGRIQALTNDVHSIIIKYKDSIQNLLALDGAFEFSETEILETSDAAAHLNSIRRFIDDNSLFLKWKTNLDFDAITTLYDAAHKESQKYAAIKTDILSDYEQDILTIDHKAILVRFRTEYTSFLKLFNRQYKQDKKAVQAHMKHLSKKVDDATIISVLDKMNQIQTIRQWFDDNGDNLNSYFGDHILGPESNFDAMRTNFDIFRLLNIASVQLEEIASVLSKIEDNENTLQQHCEFLYNGISTNWDDVREKLNWAQSFRKVINGCQVSRPFIQNVCTSQEQIDKCDTYRSTLSEAINEMSPNYQWFLSLFDEENATALSQLTMPQLADRCELCVNGQSLLEEWIDFRSIRTKCIELGLDNYLEKVEHIGIKNSDIVPIFKKRFYRLWLDAVLPKYPAVMDFRRRTHENTARDFVRLDKMQFNIAKARIRQRLISALPSLDRFSSGGDELSLLRRELGKQRKIMPIRKLFRAIPNLLMALKPCLMMSPLSVSLFLEAESYSFDTVIFDEASQVCTENAIGAISRGKQVIIVGDSKQLPPTSFFTATISDTDFDVDDDDGDSDAYESILDEAILLPERTLLWHYRSRHEHLIAFSNAKIYHNNLITFPSNVEKAPNCGVEYIYVENGTYDRGGKKGNEVEAKRVAELVFEHFKNFPNRSLGVIAFGEVQQQAIDAVLRRMRVSNQAYEPFFNEDREEAFFVKNLENVQGDERDTIIFSIGYAKPPIGEMRMNFGPLSRAGGERRLNVAITRAKYNVKLVGSIRPTDIATERINVDGPKLLRSYIDFAINGPLAILGEATENNVVEHDSPFEKSVYDYLDRKGYKLGTQVGCSGYRIDMAVKHPTLSGRYVLGIECDGASYHSARTARERDRLRQAVLEDMGWKIYRIWSTDWIKDPIAEGEKLIAAVESATMSYVEDIPIGKDDSIVATAINVSEIEIPTSDEIHNINTYLIVDNKEASDNPYNFAQYSPTNFNLLPRRNGNLDIKDCIRAIVANDFPIHYELLCQKLAPQYGRQKATSVVRREIDAELARMKSEINRKGDFLFPIPMTKIIIKMPNDRKIDHVSTEELAEAMVIIANSYIGCTKTSLIQEVSRAYGYNRTGEKINAAMQKAYALLCQQKRIEEIEEKVIVL